jgi:predicted transcriptional regulator
VEQYHAACAERSQVAAELISAGRTLADVGGMIGVSRQAIDKMTKKVRP